MVRLGVAAELLLQFGLVHLATQLVRVRVAAEHLVLPFGVGALDRAEGVDDVLRVQIGLCALLLIDLTLPWHRIRQIVLEPALLTEGIHSLAPDLRPLSFLLSLLL